MGNPILDAIARAKAAVADAQAQMLEMGYNPDGTPAGGTEGMLKRQWKKIVLIAGILLLVVIAAIIIMRRQSTDTVIS